MRNFNNRNNPRKRVDYGPDPFIFNIDKETKENKFFRRALWTDKYMQLTLMSIPAGLDIGLEVHPDLDQFIRIEDGTALVKMGENKDRLDIQKRIDSQYAFIIPAGTWHNVLNIGNCPLKLYSIYAPSQHPKGTIHRTKADALEE